MGTNGWTHSAELLSDESIGGGEILVLLPGKSGTQIVTASALKDIQTLLDLGMPASEVVIPVTYPEDIDNLVLLGL